MALGTFFWVGTKSGFVYRSDAYVGNGTPWGYDITHDGANADTLTLLSEISHGETYTPIQNTYDFSVFVKKWELVRWLINLDCSTLPAEATLTAAKLFVLPYFHYEYLADQSDIYITRGVFGDTLALADYGNQLTHTTVGGIGTHPIANGVVRPYGIEFNGTGLTWITKAGATKLCLRLQGDVNWNATSHDVPPIVDVGEDCVNDFRTRLNFISSGDARYVDVYIYDAVPTSTSAALKAYLEGYRCPYIEVEYTGADNPSYPRHRFVCGEYSYPPYPYASSWQTGIATGVDFTATITGLTRGTKYYWEVESQLEAGGEIYEGSPLGSFTTMDYPTESLTRVTALIHRWFPGAFTLEMNLGEISTQFGLPSWEEEPPPSLPPEEPTPPTPTPTEPYPTLIPCHEGDVISYQGYMWKCIGGRWERQSVIQCTDGSYKIEGDVVYKCVGGQWVAQGRF